MKYALLGSIALVACIGCKAGRSVVGTWNVDGLPVSAETIADMRADNTATVTANIDYQGIKMTVSMDGTYKVNGDSISVEGTNVKASNVPDQAKAFQGQIESFAKEKLGQVGTGKLQWHNDDEFAVVAEDGTAFTFTRKK